jgi:DNA-binding NtrC family response regulator
MGRPDILFADDDADLLALGITALRQAGYDPLPAISGDVALILLEQDLPFELVITDIVMPGQLDGFALARRARVLRPGLRVIYTTGFAGVASIRAPGAPFGDVLAKPWRIEHLLAAVRRAMPVARSIV